MRRNNMANRGGVGGPLMTDHLQDLELELELLKRKRHLIQQQQNEILYRPAVQPARFEQPLQMFEDRFDAPQRRNFSHLYDEAPRDARPFAPKRRAVSVWDNAPGDRFDGPPIANKKPRQNPFPPNRFMNNPQPFQRARPEPLPSLLGPKPLMSFGYGLAPRNQRARPSTNQTNFKRNPKPSGPNRPVLTPKKPAPNKPSPNKHSPNKPTPNKTPNAAVMPKINREKLILTADVKPRSKINGRLELALGIIVKQIKSTHDTPETLALFATPSLARVMKQCIRERLRSLMLGKEVGTGLEIVAEYRKEYPPNTDIDILECGGVEKLKQDEKSELAIKLFEEGDPELYFKKNVTKLLEVKLAEMFQKVQKVYNEENSATATEIVENLPELKKAPTEESLIPDAEETTRNASAKKHPKEEEYDKWVTLLVERKLPQLLAKHKDEIIQLLDLDQMYRLTKAAIIMNANKKSVIIAKNSNNSSNISDSSKDDPILPRNLAYFAKVHASPAIPKRRLMQEFLNRFNPKTIKRHKKNFNLLFVGFGNKEDYDNILKADQTKIGNATLTIAGNAPKQSSEQTAMIEINDENESDGALDQVLTPQLDDQINDLLTSIRKADEEAKANDTTNGEEPKTESADVATEEKVQNVETEAPEATNGNDSDVQEVCNDTEVVAVEDDEVVPEEASKVAPLKSEEENVKDAKVVPVTPAKTKAPATPSTIRTRRASRLAQNN